MDVHEGRLLGLAHYVCDPEKDGKSAYDLALELAQKIASNAVLSNYAIVSSISRISDMSAADGLFTEGLMAAVVQTGSDVQARLSDFVEKKAHKVKL